MDPNNTGPVEHGQDGDGGTPRPRPPRDPLTPDFGQPAPALTRIVRVVSGDLLLTVNPVDGSEVEVCPPGRRPERPVKRTAAERAERARAARPPLPAGPAHPRLPLLERQEERERLVRLLARGRSVRLTGPSGSGRTALLDVVAEDCSDLAPDGVIRLSGYRRTTGELLQELFSAVYDAPRHRPERDELVQLVREIGAVVVLDDLEFGGSALDELLDATPECAFLLSATPDVPAPSAVSHVEEVFLGGLDRAGGLDILERFVGRDLTEEEANWAGDLWFESEGLPLRFVQAGALLRQHDQVLADADTFDEFGVFQEAPVDVPLDAGDGGEVPLPSLAEAAAAAPLLAARLSASARETLKFAVALGGEVPDRTHLPALADDTHADAALGELVGCALVTPVGSRYRLATGVQAQLEAAGYATGAEEYAVKAARHYAWWAGHPSVGPERVSAEADAVLAALTAATAVSAPPAEGEHGGEGEGEDEGSVAVRLARQAVPAFAAGLHWGAWERALRSGAEASRLAGEVGEEAYFHHELGILALCGGQLERARTELEASIGLRGALADKRGTVAGRRALALVADRSGTTPPGGLTAVGEEAADARSEERPVPGGMLPAGAVGDTARLVTHQAAAEPARGAGGVRTLVRGTRRNLAAVGAGAALAAVLGTVVTLGMTSNGDKGAPSDSVRVGPSASQDTNDDGLGADKADDGAGGTAGATASPTPTNPGPDGTYGTLDDPVSRVTLRPSDNSTGTRGTSPSASPDRPPSKPPTPKPSVSPSGSSSSSASPTGTSTPTSTATPTDTPPSSNSASGPAPGSPTTMSGSASTSADSGQATVA
ncbi:ATP-binding protein [Streptomyces sp. NPDC007264]|uniref:ATP-binding protein n=1 Tax=Streptomyces sp. NPDC007264 TaxID=3364777 RepID=UPI0036D9B76B